MGELELTGRTALVTGGAKGIGAAITQALVAAGMQVLITGRDETALAAIRSPHIHTVRCDLTDPEQIHGLFQQARTHFDELFLLVNNAGVGAFGPFDDISLADYDRVMATNVRAPFLSCQHAFRWMRAARGGRIVNISSVVGYKGYPLQAPYVASKHALVGLTKTLAAEGQEHGIRAAIIAPGGVATDMVRDARPDLDLSTLIQPEDVARAVLFLAREPESCATDFINLRRAGAAPFP